MEFGSEDDMFGSDETANIQVNNTGKNYYKEALEKEKLNRALRDGSDSDDKENHKTNNIPGYINVQDSANLPTAHFGIGKQTKSKKKVKKTKESESDSRKTYHYLK